MKKEIKIPKSMLATFEDMWMNMSDKQKDINIEYWHSLYCKDKLFKRIKEERDYWKSRFEYIQNKLKDPLDGIFTQSKSNTHKENDE